jgi:hypothetical protein
MRIRKAINVRYKVTQGWKLDGVGVSISRNGKDAFYKREISYTEWCPMTSAVITGEFWKSILEDAARVAP